MRQNWADSLTGLCILYMVAMHVSLFVGVPIIGGLFMYFFMPWFFFKNGVYFKARPTKELLAKDAKRLLAPYIFFSVFGWIVYRLFDFTSYKLSDLLVTLRSIVVVGGPDCNSPLWFLLVLFIIRQIHNLICNESNSNWILHLELLFAFMIALSFFVLGINRPLWIPNVFLGLTYFVFGYLSKEFVNKINAYYWHYLVLLVIYVIGILSSQSSNFEGNTVDGGCLGYISWFLCSIGAIFLYKIVLCKASWLNISPLRYMGVSSMIFFVSHWPIVYAVNKLLESRLNGYMLYVVVLASVLIVGCLIDKIVNLHRFKFLVGL